MQNSRNANAQGQLRWFLVVNKMLNINHLVMKRIIAKCLNLCH